MIKRLWLWWKPIARKIGNFQARLLLTIFYAVVMFPFGMAVRLLFDPLHIKRRPIRWLNRPLESEDLTWAKRQ